MKATAAGPDGAFWTRAAPVISLLLAMIRRGEASRVSALFFLVPPATALIAWLVLGEALALAALPGMLLAVAGIYLVMRKS